MITRSSSVAQTRPQISREPLAAPFEQLRARRHQVIPSRLVVEGAFDANPALGYQRLKSQAMPAAWQSSSARLRIAPSSINGMELHVVWLTRSERYLPRPTCLYYALACLFRKLGCSHSCSAASAISIRDLATLSLPSPYAAAAATWASQINAIPYRASILDAIFSAELGSVITFGAASARGTLRAYWSNADDRLTIIDPRPAYGAFGSQLHREVSCDPSRGRLS
jgi:hypothetical protein